MILIIMYIHQSFKREFRYRGRRIIVKILISTAGSSHHQHNYHYQQIKLCLHCHHISILSITLITLSLRQKLHFFQPNQLSILEAGTTQKLPHDAGRRYLIVRNGNEIMDKFQQSVSFAVFRTVFGDAREDGLRMIAQDGKLYIQCRIEHDIGIFSIRKYPLFLRLTYRRPLGNGFTGRESPFVLISDNTSQQAIVTSRYPVVGIQ